MASESANSSEGAPTAGGADVLRVNDVLSGIPLEGADAAGACITFETIGTSTVVSIDPDGAGPATPIAVLTLANVTGKTLQDVLNEIPASM
ncbi:MAG: hypothetical protein ACT4P8_17155 [Betaproteobacteria bacterium]